MFHEKKIGILGGGQLGSMLIRYAIDYGVNIHVMDSDLNAPCARYTSNFKVGSLQNYQDVIAFGLDLDIITIEIESVNADALAVLEQMGKEVYPSSHIVKTVQDKYLQKQFLMNQNLPVAKGKYVNTKEELLAGNNTFPFCLKSVRDGYDGKGVMKINTAADLENVFNGPYLVEELISIQHEISVIVSRSVDGVVECYDPVLMVMDKDRMLLDFQLCPAHISREHAIEACQMAVKIAEGLNLVGVLAVEMFISTDNKLVVNEISPRPHNSGHHTIEACTTSQFEQHIRAILGLPLGNTKLTTGSIMMNIIEPAAYKKGAIEEALRTILCNGDAHLHWYGKKQSRPGRKIGHLTITQENMDQALSKAVMIKHLLTSITSN